MSQNARRFEHRLVRRRPGPSIRRPSLQSGWWISDRKRTARDFRFPPQMQDEGRKKFFISLFGKMRLRFDGRRCHVRFPGLRRGWSESYRTVARDKSSIVIRNADGTLSQMHFDGASRHWILLPATCLNREWFRRFDRQPLRQTAQLGPAVLRWKPGKRS